MTIKGNLRNPCGDRNVLYLGHIHVNILFLISCYSFPDVTLDGNWVKGIGDLSVLFPIAACESIITAK